MLILFSHHNQYREGEGEREKKIIYDGTINGCDFSFDELIRIGNLSLILYYIL